jgi:protein transport protein SEC61 subunit gamma-like protein
MKIEYIKIATSCAIGFALMGTVGYFIKLVFIPINNIILS